MDAILISPDFLDTLFYLYGRLALQLEYGFYPVCGFLILGAARYRTYSNFRSVGIYVTYDICVLNTAFTFE